MEYLHIIMKTKREEYFSKKLQKNVFIYLEFFFLNEKIIKHHIVTFFNIFLKFEKNLQFSPWPDTERMIILFYNFFQRLQLLTMKKYLFSRGLNKFHNREEIK